MNTEPSSSAPGLLIGRSALLDDVCPELDRRPAVAVITGEAGAGKSRFVHELLRRTTSPDAVTLVARCQEAHTPFPFAPLVEALNRFRPGPLPADLPPVTGALHALLPDLAHRLPPAPPPLRDPRAEHHRVLRALNAYTAALGKAVLVVEDLQWADASTCAFLRTVVADPPPRLGLVLTARSHTAPHTDAEASDGLPFPLRTPTHVTVIERHLAPLSAAETGALAAGLLGVQAVPEEFADRLHRWTGGLPYVVAEVMRGWPGSTECPDGVVGEPPLPASVRRVVVERLRGLPLEARQVVAAAAVLGEPAPVELLRSVAGLGEPETRRALAAALREGVLHGSLRDGGYAFPYGLARRAAYEAVAEPERCVLHLRAARSLARHTSPYPLAGMAGHYRRAGRPAQAARCLE
ncbi:AAA family ATPase, partial [Streptomyces sp. CC216C]